MADLWAVVDEASCPSLAESLACWTKLFGTHTLIKHNTHANAVD